MLTREKIELAKSEIKGFPEEFRIGSVESANNNNIIDITNEETDYGETLDTYRYQCDFCHKRTKWDNKGKHAQC